MLCTSGQSFNYGYEDGHYFLYDHFEPHPSLKLFNSLLDSVVSNQVNVLLSITCFKSSIVLVYVVICLIVY